MAGKKLAAAWQNRIIGEGVERPDQLLANPSNWRIHPKHQQDALSAVLDNVGWVQRVIVNKQTGHIVDGHLRVSLAISRNEAEVPVVYVDLTEDEELTVLATIDPLSAMAATDSAKLAELLASVQTDDAALEAVLRGVGETAGLDMGGAVPDAPEVDVDRAEELRAKWGVEYGDLWRVPSKHGGEHRILCGDSTNAADVARVMGGGKPLMMVTDPPYGVDYDANWRNEAAEKGLINYAASRVGVVENDNRVDWTETYKLFAGNVVYCWHADRHASSVQANLEQACFEIRSQIIWAKSGFVISRGHYHWQHEPCWYAVRKGATAEWAGDRSQSTLWEIVTQDGLDTKTHSTQKPLECMARPIRNHGQAGGGVYDPFLGSGTTAVASEQLARVCYAVEISPAYVAVALERLSLMGLTPEREAADG